MWHDMCDKSDEECGKHSGIPECCRQFFHNVWKKVMFKEYDFFGCEESHIWYADYIRCPGCRHTGAYVHIKPCPVELRVPDVRP